MKKCSKCKEFKSLDNFHKNNNSCSKLKLRSRCKTCISIHTKERREKLRLLKPIIINKELKNSKNRQNKKEYNRKYKYNKNYSLTLEQYNDMLKEQNYVCAICGKPETMKHQNGNIRNLAVDHCHKTGKVRGLLCSAHNRGIGYFGDDIEMLQEAIKYLENKKGQS